MRRSTQTRYISFDPGSNGSGGGLLTRIVAFIVGAIVLAAAIFLGAIFIAGIVGLILIGSLVAMARLWWLRRQTERYEETHGDINAEYTVVDEDKQRD